VINRERNIRKELSTNCARGNLMAQEMVHPTQLIVRTRLENGSLYLQQFYQQIERRGGVRRTATSDE
jgi:hypothetical protein